MIYLPNRASNWSAKVQGHIDRDSRTLLFSKPSHNGTDVDEKAVVVPTAGLKSKIGATVSVALHSATPNSPHTMCNV